MVLPVLGQFGKFIHQYQESKRVCLLGGLVGKIVFTEMLGQLFMPEAVHLKIDYRGPEGPNIPVTHPRIVHALENKTPNMFHLSL